MTIFTRCLCFALLLLISAEPASAQTRIRYLLTSPSPNVAEAAHSSVPEMLGYWKDAGLDVEAEASSGRVTSDLPFVGIRTDREQMKGKINGGGKSLFLRSGAGSITIKPSSNEVAAR